MKITQVTDALGFSNFKEKGMKEASRQKSFDPKELGEKNVFLAWETVSRPEKKLVGAKATRTMTIIGVFVGLLLVIMQEFFLIFLIASVIFISHVLSKAEPEIVKHEISNHGISYNGQLYYWYELKHFFFMQSAGFEILAVDTWNSLPGRLFLVLGEKSKDKDKIKEYLTKYIAFLPEPPHTFLDKTYDAVMGKFNFDD